MSELDLWTQWNQIWTEKFRPIVDELMRGSDSGHDLAHIRRVLRNAEIIGRSETGDPWIVLPAVWFHDCIAVPKNSPLRSQASRMAAAKAAEVLTETLKYPNEYLREIVHAIESHSFSAGITPTTREAKIVQDADRLEALGAIGLARCLMTGGSLQQELMHASEPFPLQRTANESCYSIDHLFQKLLKLHSTMQTKAGQRLARERTTYLCNFLKQLADETGCSEQDIEHACAQHNIDWQLLAGEPHA